MLDVLEFDTQWIFIHAENQPPSNQNWKSQKDDNCHADDIEPTPEYVKYIIIGNASIVFERRLTADDSMTF